MKIKKNILLIDQHDKNFMYGGKFGGNFIPETLKKPVDDLTKLFSKLRKDKRFLSANSQLEWNTRVFDQRTRLTEYVCEEPVFNTQRLGYQARKIMSYLQ